MVNKPETTAIGLFNYAHSYAQSAATLVKNQTDATHWNAPIYFLYFHAIELYLKASLVACGIDLEELRKKYGHSVRPLAELAKERGVELSDEAETVIDLMDKTDNVISSRYIRTGNHKRLPYDAFFNICHSLHFQIIGKVYESSGVTRRPTLRE